MRSLILTFPKLFINDILDLDRCFSGKKLLGNWCACGVSACVCVCVSVFFVFLKDIFIVFLKTSSGNSFLP